MRGYPVTDFTSYQALALIDTGATTSGITPKVIAALGLTSLGKRPIGSAQGEGQADRYMFRIGLRPPNFDWDDAPNLPYLFDAIMGFGLGSGFKFEVLLGMDILSQCDFRMDRFGNAVLSFG